jgi:ribosomal protein S27AE
MRDQLQIINLKCPNCGAKLEVSSDMNQFLCGYCGTEQTVVRRGGTVSLQLISEAISRVQFGTDKTAAELAIRRLRDDLGALELNVKQVDSQEKIQMDNLLKNVPRVVVWSAIIAIVSLLMGANLVGSIAALAGVFAIGITMNISSGIDKRRKSARQECDAQSAVILAEIAEHEKVVSPTKAAIQPRTQGKLDSLTEAAWSGNLAEVDRLLNKGLDVNQMDSDGNTALALARANGNLEIETLLLSHGAADSPPAQ